MMSTCYMCNAEATSNEHVPPQCLFPEQKDMPGTRFREDLIKVPSCDIHNTAKCKDDEYLLFIMSSHFENNVVAKSQMTTKILRAIQRRPHLNTIYTSKTKTVFLDAEETMAFQFKHHRINRVLDHVTRGLYYHEFKRKWNKRIVIASPAMMAMDVENAILINQATQQMAARTAVLFNDVPTKGAHPDAFWYQIHAEPENARLVVRMCFYQGVEVIAISDPKFKQKACAG